MTNYSPQSLNGTGPKYVQLADLMERDIAAGMLEAGDKLPPQRNLAYDIGVTIGTVGRAYQLMIERGLVVAEVGRGTYVRAQKRDEEFAADFGLSGFLPQVCTIDLASVVDGENFQGGDELRGVHKPLIQNGQQGQNAAPSLHLMNSTSAPDLGQSELIERVSRDILAEQPAKSIDYIRRLEPEWQLAGRQWLATGDWVPSPEVIVPAQGVHAAFMSIISTITQPGDKIAIEGLTYSPFARAMALIGRRVVQVGMGKEGVDPDEFERVCAQQHPKVFVSIPTLHNPTTTILPLEHRQAIVKTAQKHNVIIVEDNIYGKQVDDAPPPLVALAPEQTFHIGGLSKSVSAGIRASWVASPPHYRDRILFANKSMTGGHSYLLAELAARIVLSGEAARISEMVSAEFASRESIAREIFKGLEFASHPMAPFLWLKLKEPWLPETFKTAARRNGMMIDVADAFKAGQDDAVFHRVRIAFVAPRDGKEFRSCLMLLKTLMEAGPGGYDDYH